MDNKTVVILVLGIVAIVLSIASGVFFPAEAVEYPADGFDVGDDVILTGDSRVHTITSIDEDRTIVLDDKLNMSVEEFDTCFNGMAE